MSAEKALFEAYREWQRLAEAEGSAIRSGNWSLLKECQGRIQRSQILITRLTLEVRGEWGKLEGDQMAKEKILKSIVSGLMDITRKNLDSLSVRLESARVNREMSTVAGRNLKRLQTSYVAASPARWVSFS